MKKNIAVLSVIGLFSFVFLSYAADRDDAKALVKRAAAYVKYQGKEKALAEISTPKGLFRKEIVEKANSKGSGWVDYVYLNPETNRQEHKTTYIQKVGDIIICCGVYKDYSHEGD